MQTLEGVQGVSSPGCVYALVFVILPTGVSNVIKDVFTVHRGVR